MVDSNTASTGHIAVISHMAKGYACDQKGVNNSILASMAGTSGDLLLHAGLDIVQLHR